MREKPARKRKLAKKTAPFVAEPKPPLGIIPRQLWLEKRIIEVSACIGRYSGHTAYLEDIPGLCAELEDLIVRWKSLEGT